MRAALVWCVTLCGCPAPSTPGEPLPETTTPLVKGPVTSEASSTKPTPPPDEKILWVHEALVDCEGAAGPMECMQIRESASGDWTWFYDRIEGFEYEPGHRYQLRVKIETRADAPADASSKRYKLIQVLAKEPVP